MKLPIQDLSSTVDRHLAKELVASIDQRLAKKVVNIVVLEFDTSVK